MDKKNVKFDFKPDMDFRLLGLGCRENDYRLSWAINKAMNINLAKSENLEIKNPKFSEIQQFSVYVNEVEESEEELLLISNRCENGYLIEELKNIDYFLLFRNYPKDDFKSFIPVVKSIDEILLVVEIDPKELKSGQKFIF